MFCTRCKRTSHYRSNCYAKTFNKSKTRIKGTRPGYSGRYQKKTYKPKRAFKGRFAGRKW